MLKDYLTEKNISIYELSKTSGLPYSSLNDLANGRCNIDNVRFGIIRTLAQTLELSIDTLYNICDTKKQVQDIYDDETIDGLIFSKGKEYFVTFNYEDVERTIMLAQTKTNAMLFIEDIARWKIEDTVSDLKMEKIYALYS